MDRVDVAVIGGGIVGLAAADAILRMQPRTRLVLLEKEHELASHQSRRNSGVLHSGIYYRPGSLKARLTTVGRAEMVRFCEEQGIAHEICGKVVIATSTAEVGRLEDLFDRGRRNEVRVERISLERLHELEPHAAGVAALHVLDTGIVDFADVCRALGRRIEAAGGEIRLGTRVRSARNGIVETEDVPLHARVVVNCGGLQSDRLAGSTDVRIVPFRGEFHELVPHATHLVKSLIYPVPDPLFPFLGPHLTRGIHGGAHAGPNAVLALAREGYSWSVVDPAELRDLLRHPGFRLLVRRYWRVGAAELARSLSRRRMARDLARLVPEIRRSDLAPAPAGVRAQALDSRGNLLDDFVIRETAHAVHVVNAPSPAATASLPIGRYIAGLATPRLS
jgi:L-2-hydroxyglutarate oxidase